MWPRRSAEPSGHETDAINDGPRYNRYTFANSTIDWTKHDYRPPMRCARIANFEHRDFCAVNRETAWKARGPVSAVLLYGCGPVWDRDPIPLDSVCWVMASDNPAKTQPRCFANVETLVKEAKAKSAKLVETWHMPLDETTVDNARRHCGMPVGDLSEAVREMKDDLEIAIMCGRNGASDVPRAIESAIHTFCHHTKPDAEAVIRRMAQEAGAGDFTVTCLQNQLGLTSPMS
nr:hypothetical protein [Pandoravirus massiliensis]